MDIANVSKVASRKRTIAGAEKLCERVSREATKIIKLKVGQDTAYWDLKEKKQQLENNHEKLQQNMVDVQMQHEAISGQYQDELRLRPETLNKLSSTREICDVLEDYSERLKETLSRCKTDTATLVEAYQKSGQFVKDLKEKQLQADQKNCAVINSLKEKNKLITGHSNQMAQFFETYKQQSIEQNNELKNKLEATELQRDDLVKISNELTRDLDQQKHSMDMKDKNILSLQNDMKRLLHEYNSQCSDMKSIISKLEKELAESKETVESLKKALTNQDEFTATMCDQKNVLHEKVATLEEESSKLYDEITVLKKKLEEFNKANDILVLDVVTRDEANRSLEKQLAEKNQLLEVAEKQTESLTSQLATLKIEKDSVLSELTKATEDVQDKTTSIEQLKAVIDNCQTKTAELQKALQQCRTTNEEKIQELTITIETKHNENTSKAETISKLMNEIKMCMEMRNKLETNIDKMKRELEVEREKGQEKETKFLRQVEHHEVVVKDKEKELSKHMSIIMELRAEKEELHEKIAGMQGTIDNIQRELTGRMLQPPQEQPEQDDNAVSLIPVRKQKNTRPSEIIRSAVPTRRQPEDPESLLYTIFSDSSMDSNAVESTEVNRRFETVSRGQHLPPLPLSKLKRRRVPPQTEEIVPECEDAISLSQLRGEVKKRENTFFRTKRPENKLKKFKGIPDSNL